MTLCRSEQAAHRWQLAASGWLREPSGKGAGTKVQGSPQRTVCPQGWSEPMPHFVLSCQCHSLQLQVA